MSLNPNAKPFFGHFQDNNLSHQHQYLLLNPNAKSFTYDILSEGRNPPPLRTGIVYKCLNSEAAPFYPLLCSPGCSSTVISSDNFDARLDINASIFHPASYKPPSSRVNRADQNCINITTEVHEKESVAQMDATLPDSEQSGFSCLQNIRKNNSERIILGHLNINSIRNKFEMITEFIKGNVDLMLFSETKIDDSFPTSQFLISGFSSPFRRDRNACGGGLLFYVRSDIPVKQLFCDLCDDIECIIIKISLYSRKWLIYGIYNPNKALISNHLDKLSRSINKYSPSYDNIIVLGDFNCPPSEEIMNNFFNEYDLKNLINEPTCFKSTSNPSCIDLIVTNRPRSFQNSKAIVTGISDFHKLTITVMKMKFAKKPPSIISYRSYKHFSPHLFRADLDNTLLYVYDLHNISNDTFTTIIMELLDKHAPVKFRYIRANDNRFMTKELRKAIMQRSKLRNRLNRLKTSEANLAYKKQRNICTSLLRKTKRLFFNNLNSSVMSDNKTFWKISKPFFSDKITINSKITLLEDGIIHDNDTQVAKDFGTYFSNIIACLDIPNPEHDLTEHFTETDPVIKAINKFEKHPSILKINESMNIDKSFSFTGYFLIP